MKTIGVGVVGTGFMARTHLKAWQKIPDTRIAAICGTARAPIAQSLASTVGNIGDGKPLELDFNQIKTYTEFDHLLADPAVDVIDICVPTPLHPALAIAALRAGKHVLCEKPLARTTALCREIVEAAAQAKGFFMPAMVMRFWPEWAWLKQTIAAQTYGRVLAARFRRVAPPPGWGKENYFKGDDSGGALLDLHIHDTDFVQHCFGRPRSVFSTGLSRHSGAIDHVVTTYQVAANIPVTAEGSWLMTESHGFKMEYTVNFENAVADFDLARGRESLKLSPVGQPTEIIACDPIDGYQAEIRYFANCIQTNTPPKLVTAQDALTAVQICEAENQSIKTGAAVTL